MFRFWLPISLVTAVGIIISTAVALRIYEQEIAVERSLFERGVDDHARLIQERLTERESLARMAAAMFAPPTAIRGDSLVALRVPFRSLTADFVSVGWVPRVEPWQTRDALQALAANGMTPPQFLGPNLQPLDRRELDGSVYPVIDIEPRTADNLKLLGVDVAADPRLKRAIDAASENGQPFASDPGAMIQMPEHIGVILFAPVFRPGSERQAAGFVSFAYRVDQMLARVGEAYPFSITLAESDHAEWRPLLSITPDGVPQATAADDRARDPDVLARNLTFGTRQWTLYYQPSRDPRSRAMLLGGNSAAIGLALTAIIVGLFGYVVRNNLRLSGEIESRIGIERRLNAVIRELNHRVKNMLAVIQSIVLRSLRSDTRIDEARPLLVGRLHALSHAVSLLTDTQWQGIGLRDLFSAQVLPATERISREGPDIFIGARAGQAMALLFFELASNARKHGALSTEQGSVVVRWTVEGSGANAVFRLRWEEVAGRPPKQPRRAGFGSVVLDRVAPEAIRGWAKRSYGASGFVYELEAPLAGLSDGPQRPGNLARMR